MLPHIPIINGLSDFVNRFGKFLSMTICLATEVWAGTQTSVAQAPCFGGLLGPAVRTASRSERFEANRRRRLLGRDRAYAATLGQDAPHGHSPCAPPRQAGKPGPIGHCVVGFCGTARVERAWSIWAKNRSGRAVTCVSFPPSQRRAPFRGIHKGVPPYVCFLPCFLHKQKTSRPPGRDRASCAAYGTLLKKGKVLRSCTKRATTPDGTGHPVPLAAHLLKRQGAAQLHKKGNVPRSCTKITAKRSAAQPSG